VLFLGQDVGGGSLGDEEETVGAHVERGIEEAEGVVDDRGDGVAHGGRVRPQIVCRPIAGQPPGDCEG